MLTIILGFFKFSSLLPMLLKYWYVVLILMFLFVVWYQNFSNVEFLFGMDTIPSLQKKLGKADNAINVCKNGNDKLVAAINIQNNKIKIFKQKSNKIQKRLNKLIMEINKKQIINDKNVENILNSIQPKNCKESIQYLVDGAVELKW